MKTFGELTDIAIEAFSRNIARAEFLASLLPEERSDGALQFDRAGRLMQETVPIEAQINEEARRLAVVTRLADFLHTNPPRSGEKLLEYIVTKRPISLGMRRDAEVAQAYAERVTEEDLVRARAQAIANLTRNRTHLMARLGVSERGGVMSKVRR